jgi:ubiquinone/menaquinone biosynthesis C-methylase UbiE
MSFWNLFGQKSVALAELKPGMKVLDLCSGSGASAIPAAEKVGPEGEVIACDIAEELLDLARKKAESKSLYNISFQHADVNQLDFPSNHFDAVIIVFGIFFNPDMEGLLKTMYKMLKPGGKVVVTVWQEDSFEPLKSLWRDEVLKFIDDPFPKERPWERIYKIQGFEALFRDAGIKEFEIIKEDHKLPLNKPEDWAVMTRGSGYRGVLDQLEAEQQERFLNNVIAQIADQKIDIYNGGVLYGVAVKPA